jgi:sodium-coupled neutral amino acid transporter 11
MNALFLKSTNEHQLLPDYGSLKHPSSSDVGSDLPLISSLPDENHNESPVAAQVSHDEGSNEYYSTAGEATILSEVFNISKNLIGGGVLSLSGGIAMYADSPDAVISAIMWVVLLGATFAYFCLIIARACNMTRSSTYRECWERTVGGKGSDFVSVINILDPLLGIYANASILSQSLQLLLQGIDVNWSLQFCLVVVSVFGIIPLCMMKNLNALAPFSAIGMISVLCALAAMSVRLLDGSYEPGGKYYDEVIAKPKFGSSNHPWSISALPFVCMVYTSFDMHYNSPTYYAELKDASIPRFTTTVIWSFAVTSLLYFAIGVVGFLTFGSSCDSYIL